MPQWETILDKSSHISPVKINTPKNHSTDRLEILFKTKTTSRSTMKATENKIKPTTTSKRMSIKTIIISILIFFSLSYMTAFITCNTSKYSPMHSVCKRVDLLPSPYKLYNNMFDNDWLRNKKEMSRMWLDQTVENYYEATEPYITKIQQGYHWTEATSIKTAYREASTFAKSMIYTPENQFRLVYYARLFQQRYITPCWTYIKDIIYKYLVQLRHQMDDYIKSGSIESLHRNEHVENGYEKDDGNNGIMEDKLKRTAKKILDYIDQINKESANTGMKQDEAREKAQEIIKSITGATTNDHTHIQNVVNINEESTDVDKIAYEIQEIMELASTEKIQLDEQLDLIQSRLSLLQMAEEQETQLLIPALKAEIDHLRAIAENNVRQRTKSSLQLVQGMNTNPSIKNRMKEDLQSAQRAALKDLRQVYVKLYQTNKLIDELLY